MKRLLNLIKYQQVGFDLPLKTVQMLTYYAFDARLIDMDRFIADTLKSYIKDNGNHVRRGDIVEISPDMYVTLYVQLPRLLILNAWWVSLKACVSMTSILSEALGHSLPFLMEIEQAQEDFMFEQAENPDSTNNKEK